MSSTTDAVQRLPLSSNQHVASLGTLAAFLVLVLAFFLAATPVRNSDFWLHLATGRAIAQGQWQAEPFSYAPAAAHAVNHAWLYDLTSYGLYLALTGTGLAVLKSLLAVAIAAVIIACGWRGNPVLSSLAASLAVVALGPWLALKPVTLSMLFLALTLYYLERCCGSETRPSRFRWWPLFLLGVLWANMDCWFFLGPATVALYGAGAWLTRITGNPPAHARFQPRGRWLAFTLLASVVACLVSPYTYRNLQLPAEILPGTLSSDVFLREQFLSPFAPVYALPDFFRHPAGVAFWTLAALAVFSFVLVRSPWRWQRFLTWMFFFALSRYLNAAVPFFVVAAGAVLALNLADYLARRATASAPAWLPALGVLGTLTLLALVPLAWAGMLQPGQPGPRAWVVAVDPSLKRAANELARLRRQGTLAPEGNGFNFSPAAANFMAWFCPVEKGFVTSRLAAADSVWSEYSTVRRALRERTAASASDWRAILRRRGIDHLVLVDNDPRLVLPTLANLLQDPREWPLLYAGGTTVIVGWRDPERTGPDTFKGRELDLDRIACVPGVTELVPQTAPDGEAPPYHWWDAFRRPRSGSSFDHQQCKLLSELFQMMRPLQQKKNELVCRYGRILTLVGAGGSSGAAPLDCVQALRLLPLWTWTVRETLDDAPPGALFLAIQAGRRALHDDPGNPETHYLLGEAYYQLNRHSRERVWVKSFPQLGRVRTVQTVAAFVEAVRLQPERIEAHFRLAELYLSIPYKDKALEHFQIIRDLLRRKGPGPGEGAEAFAERLQGWTNKVDSLSREVGKLADSYMLRTQQTRRTPDRARLAGEMGLAGTALQVLLASDISAFGTEGLEMELKLLLNTGAVTKVRSWMKPEHEERLGEEKAKSINTLLAAASGDYRLADRVLADATDRIGAKEARLPLRSVVAMRIATAVLERKNDPADLMMVWGYAFRLNLEAQTRVVRGLLALEAGKIPEAAELFRQALTFWASPAGKPLTFFNEESASGRHIAIYHLQRLEQAAAGAGRQD